MAKLESLKIKTPKVILDIFVTDDGDVRIDKRDVK